ncbi:hypothetical protein I4U23_010474 [Adineta vaga]|nr:hypothetical protein I4U23_010474 [Adineta vaga]
MLTVNTIKPGTVFAWFMLMMIIRRIVLLLVAGFSGWNRPFQPDTRVPEDKILKRDQIEPSNSTINPVVFTKDIRVNKTIGNDSENDTYFIILLFATAVFSDTVSGDGTRTIIYGVIYLFFRIIYAITYILALQPWRTIAYIFGLACTLACSLDLVITLSRRTY